MRSAAATQQEDRYDWDDFGFISSNDRALVDQFTPPPSRQEPASKARPTKRTTFDFGAGNEDTVYRYLAQTLEACSPYTTDDPSLQAMYSKAGEHLERRELAAAGRILVALTFYTPDIRL
jgi:hypothetical protein